MKDDGFTGGGELCCNDCRIGVLEKRYSHAILLSLLNNRHQKKTALLKSISLSSCIPKRIDDLEKQGLITTTTKRFEKNAKWIELTPLGEAVAQHLSMIYELCTAGVSLSSPESLGVPDGL